MKILAIESSCDETAAAVVEDGVKILSNVVVSQVDIFAEYGGVIPEVAARSHLEAILPVVHKALDDAGLTKDDIDAIAVTHTPGLLGSLLIGTLTARMLAILWGKPLYAVHHLKSHIYANWLKEATASEISASADALLTHRVSSTAHSVTPASLNSLDAVASQNGGGLSQLTLSGEDMIPLGSVSSTRLYSLSKDTSSFGGSAQLCDVLLNDEPEFPLLALIISGGHTQIIYMEKHNQFEIIGTTRDDAVGECFDKVAKILGLPYPGGPSISAISLSSAITALGSPVRSRGMLDTASLRASNLPCTSSNLTSMQKAKAEWYKVHPNYKLPRPKVEGLDFSFSGLKTAVLRAVQTELGLPINTPSFELAEKLTEQQKADFAASFQETACEILIEKLKMALEAHPEARTVVFAGGVSANQALREKALGRPEKGLPGEFERYGVKVLFPEPRFAGDNAAMVGAAAYFEVMAGVKPTDPYALNIAPRTPVE